MDPCPVHSRALMIEHHMRKLKKLKTDLLALEIKRQKETLAILELEQCLKRCKIST